MRRTVTALMLATACVLAQAASETGKSSRPVIENSFISAPQQSGEYALIKTVNYADEGNVLAGVGFRYRDPLLPAMTTDIFVYPVGEGESLAKAEKNFRASVAMAAQQGAYSDVDWGQSHPYELTRNGSTWAGRVITMRMRTKEGAVASRTYLFHHGLYDYKLRLDVPATQAAELPDAADALVRAVLPQVEVVSVGSCGKELQINVLENDAPLPTSFVDGVSGDGFGIVLRKSELQPPAAAGSSEQDLRDSPLVKRTMIAKQRQIASGCTHPPYTPPTENLSVLKLHFPADFWRSDAPRPKP